MTIFVTWQLIVTLDSIRNSCDVSSLWAIELLNALFIHLTTIQIQSIWIYRFIHSRCPYLLLTDWMCLSTQVWTLISLLDGSAQPSIHQLLKMPPTPWKTVHMLKYLVRLIEYFPIQITAWTNFSEAKYFELVERRQLLTFWGSSHHLLRVGRRCCLAIFFCTLSVCSFSFKSLKLFCLYLHYPESNLIRLLLLIRLIKNTTLARPRDVGALRHV